MAIIWTGIMPHPPIIVGAVGGRRSIEAQTTIESMQALCTDLVSRNPARIIVFSPHTPRPNQGIAAWQGPELRGHFGQFGAADCGVSLPCDQVWLKRFRAYYPHTGEVLRSNLDHGALVPLYFCAQAGWGGPTCILGLPWDDDQSLDHVGLALSAACNDEIPTAIIASGDMSHCLKPEGPYGFDPKGPTFDQTFVAHVRRGDYQAACSIDKSLRREARQDVLESSRIAWRATDFHADHHHFYSYEGPFGVGYTVMRCYAEAA